MNDVVMCAYCESYPATHRDHVVPQSRGGADEVDNCLMACAACNLSKSDRLPSEWRPSGLPDLVYQLEESLKPRYTMTPRAKRGRGASASSDPREPSHDSVGVPAWGGEAEGGSWCSANPFERALRTVYRELDEPDRDALIFVHDDLYAARTIALSIFGRAWARHVADVYGMIRQVLKENRETALRLGVASEDDS